MFKNLYLKNFIKRFDDEGYIKYFSEKDFSGLLKTPYSFKSGDNLLKGCFYYYAGCEKKEPIIFCHGYGGGHRSYMREINEMAKRGFKVLTYDVTGCFESEGENVHSMTQSLCDLNNLIKALSAEEEFKTRKITVVGHSWGAYAALNILNFTDCVKKVVAISPFLSIKSIAGQEKYSFLYLNSVLGAERKIAPEYADAEPFSALQKTDAKVLIIHSKDDDRVFFKKNTALLQKKIKKPQVKFLTVNGKYHNPQYTLSAVNYYRKVFGEFAEKIKKKQILTLSDKKAFFKEVDWLFMTEQDQEIFNIITAFIG